MLAHKHTHTHTHTHTHKHTHKHTHTNTCTLRHSSCRVLLLDVFPALSRQPRAYQGGGRLGSQVWRLAQARDEPLHLTRMACCSLLHRRMARGLQMKTMSSLTAYPCAEARRSVLSRRPASHMKRWGTTRVGHQVKYGCLTMLRT